MQWGESTLSTLISLMRLAGGTGQEMKGRLVRCSCLPLSLLQEVQFNFKPVGSGRNNPVYMGISELMDLRASTHCVQENWYSRFECKDGERYNLSSFQTFGTHGAGESPCGLGASSKEPLI